MTIHSFCYRSVFELRVDSAVLFVDTLMAKLISGTNNFHLEDKTLQHAVDLKRSMVFSCCLTCEHWTIYTETCKKFNVRPPLFVIVDGCEHYEEGVPF